MSRIEIVPAPELAAPLKLLEDSLRSGEPVPESFVEELRKSVEVGDIEFITARTEDRTLGLIVLAYHPNISAGSLFASIEDLYVRPEARRQGIGRALLTAADERCAARGISYVEVQVDDEYTETFYKALGYEPDTGVRVLSRSLPIDDPVSKC